MKALQQVTLVVLLSIFVFSASIVNAQEGPNKNSKMQNRGIENKIPDLTEQQKSDIKDLRTAFMKDIQHIKAQMDIKRAELKALQTAEKPDIDAINKKIDEKANLRTQLEKKKAAFRQSVRALLTDDQKVVFDQKMMQHEHSKGCSHEHGKQCEGHGRGHACKK